MSEKPNILVVDDKRENLLATNKILESLDVSVLTAESGKEALSLANANECALVLLDVFMPGMDGFETAERLRDNQTTRHVPIIFLTASHLEDGYVFMGYESGAVDYLIKPVDTVVLRSKVAVFVELYKQRKELDKKAELEQALERLNRTRDDLEKTVSELTNVNAALDRFAYVASHDLKEPLRNILCMSDLLLEESSEQLSAESRSYCDSMRASAKRMDQLISGLLDYSKVYNHPFVFADVDLNAIVDSVVQDLDPLMRSHKVRLAVERLPVVRGDPSQLRQLFLKLLSNSLKYARRGVDAYVRVYSHEGDNVEIVVEDNGVGFEQRFSKTIFEPFRRLHTKNEYEGVGMGLPICQKIVERHEGTIEARGYPNSGSTFIVRLPLPRLTQTLANGEIQQCK